MSSFFIFHLCQLSSFIRQVGVTSFKYNSLQLYRYYPIQDTANCKCKMVTSDIAFVLTPRSRTLFEIVQKFIAVFCTIRSISVSTTLQPEQTNLSLQNPSILKINFNIILLSLPWFPKRSLFYSFLHETLQILQFSATCVTFPASTILLNLITRTLHAGQSNFMRLLIFR